MTFLSLLSSLSCMSQVSGQSNSSEWQQYFSVKKLDFLSPEAFRSCSGAYSLSQLSSSYTGPIIKLTRSTDWTTSDFYPQTLNVQYSLVSGSTTLSTWLNGATGYVVVWYDQCGYGNHARQSSTDYQPTIDLVNNRVDFTANYGYSFLDLPSGTVPMHLAYTVSTWHGDINNSNGGWLGAGDTNGGNFFRRYGNNYLNSWFMNDFQLSGYGSGNVVTYRYDGALTYQYVNKNLQGTKNRKTWSGSGRNEVIGAAFRSNANLNEYLNGQLYSLFIFKSAISTDEREVVEYKAFNTVPALVQSVRTESYLQSVN